jgi:hypothetical protein
MIKVFKWLWDKAEAQGEQRVLDQLYGLRSYHQQQAEIAYLKAKHEPDEPRYDDKMEKFMFPKLTPQEHSAVASKVGDLITVIERTREDRADGR